MLRNVLISATLGTLLVAGSAMAGAASSTPSTNNPNCNSITNPVLKKACQQKPPPSCGDPSSPGNGQGNGNGNGQNNGSPNGNGNGQCPVSK